MAWPLSRLLTFANGTTVTPSFLNDTIQDYIIGIFGGTKSVKSVHADGVGGNTASAAAGEIKATGAATISGNIVSVHGNVTSDTGYVSAGTTVTAGTGVTSTTGDVVATTGKLTAGKLSSAEGGIETGEFFKDNTPLGSGFVAANGAGFTDTGSPDFDPIYGPNIASVDHAGTGEYHVVLCKTPGTWVFPVVSFAYSTDGSIAASWDNSNHWILVKTLLGASPADLAFNVIVFGY